MPSSKPEPYVPGQPHAQEKLASTKLTGVFVGFLIFILSCLGIFYLSLFYFILFRGVIFVFSKNIKLVRRENLGGENMIKYIV